MVVDGSASEAERLDALARYRILDSPPEPAFDGIAQLAAELCGTPSALITLIDSERQWFKARVNFELSETQRAIAICDYTIRGRQLLVVEDTLRDPRFMTNPLVTASPNIRFYAGAPLVMSDGNAIGSLAVLDYQPRTISQPQRTALLTLAAQVVAQLELRWQLMRETERFQLFARATNDVIYDWDLRTNDLWLSESFSRFYGDPGQVTSFDAWLGLVHVEDRDRIAHSLRELVASGNAWNTEYRFCRANGSYATVLDRGYLMRDAAGTPQRMVGAMIDLSERLELEGQVLRAQRMQAIGQLASGVAHDFNNILTVIECNAFLLRRNATTAGRAEHLDEIVHAVERAASLTRQLLLVSRKQPMRRTSIDLHEVVTRMSQMLRRVIGEHIELRVDGGPTPAIQADVSMMEQIVLNLAVNARDAMPRGGTLSIETVASTFATPVLVGGVQLPSGRYAELRVRDTGAGIPPEVMPRIYDAFFTTKEPGTGTGLGLSTVHSIVRQHHGAIDVESSRAGTMFVIYLPVTGDRDAARAASPKLDAPRGSETILVVEDEPLVRNGVCSLLVQAGYRVLEAPSAVIAMEVWQQHRDEIALVLTDMMMPGGMTGHDLGERLHAERPELPIVYTSGYSEQLEGLSGDNFLAKPYTPAQLAQVIRAQLDRRQTRTR